MRCFVHNEIEAVGTCRACNKGLCPACACDLRHSISCRGDCEEKAGLLHSQVAQSSVVLQTQRRNRFFAPFFFIVVGAAFMAYASGGESFLNLGTVLGGSFIAFGIVLAVLGQRYAKELDRRA
jgi:hypothetical protein